MSMPNEPYYVPAWEGEANLLLGQVGRVLAWGRHTGMTYGALHASGPKGRAIPLHFHEREHELFFCTAGRMQVWADGESRIFGPGGFANVPRGTIHAYQFHDDDTEFMGPISPGGWERFFQFNGTPYKSPGYPPFDNSAPPFDKFKASETEFKMTFRPDLPYAEVRRDAADDTLPGKSVPYFLKADAGPKHVLYGQICRLLMTGAESNGELGFAVVSGPRGAAMPLHRHDKSAETIYGLAGVLSVNVEGRSYRILPGDSLTIPMGAAHGYVMEGGVTRFVTTNGLGGIERLFAVAGEPTQYPTFPNETPTAPDPKILAKAAGQIDIVVIGA